MKRTLKKILCNLLLCLGFFFPIATPALEQPFFNEAKQVTSVVTIDDDTLQPILCQTFTYDNKGRILTKSVYGNLSGSCASPLIVDDAGYPAGNEIEFFSLHYSYDSEGRLQNKDITSHEKFDILNENPRAMRWFNFSFKEKFDAIMHAIFDKGFLQFAGFYDYSTSMGVYNPGHEVHDKVRVTAINGILNIRPDIDFILSSLSSSHGDVTIHYVFRPTEGWTRDVWNCALVKLGLISKPAKYLADLWKKLIKDMSGIEGGGNIVHYAHSIGATDTFNAMDLLTEKERQMIHVITLGSPSLIPADAGFGSVINYASRRDAICMIDLLGYLRAWCSSDTNVVFIGDSFGLPEHTIYTDTYQAIIIDLGQQFNEKHR